MKEHIYSIPLTEALEQNCGCILCILEKKLEEQAVDYFLGASMMEPDSRELTNKKGFCRRHMTGLFNRKNRLSLALTLETHIQELEKKVCVHKKVGVFSKESTAVLTASSLSEISRSCALCDKLNKELRSAAGNLSYMWSVEKGFREMFESSEGLCLEHTALAIEMCDKELSGKKKDEYISMLIKKQKEKLSKLYEDLHGFTLSFDYRNANKELTQNEKESVENAVKHLTKYME